MKKMKKSLMSLILFLIYTNNIYATTTGHYTVSEKGSGFGKIFLLIVGVGLVSLVLFVGYIMDKNENTKKKREKFIKKQSENDIYANNYKTNKIDEWIEKYKLDEEQSYDEDENEEVEEESDEDSSDDSDYYTQEIKLTNEFDKDEEDGIGKIDDFERNLIERYDDETEDEEEEQEDDELEEYDDEEDEDEEIIIEDNDFKDYTNILDLMNSTMVFNSNDLKDEEKPIEKNKEVKGYDFEEDDLSELESIIKAANIKRYTRKKNKTGQQIKQKKKVTVFKKEKDDSDIISQTRRKNEELKESQKPKRGRKPGSKNKEENLIEEKQVKEPAKRGRKPGSKNKPKEPAKRGRKPGSKNKTKETSKKRGRPPKKDSEKKAKRGRPPKN